jgi:hypothetical protein
MSSRRPRARGSTAARALIALAAVSVCLGAVVAYASTRPEARRGGDGEKLPQARFIEYPEATRMGADPQFRFHVSPRSLQQQQPPASQPSRPAPAPPPRRFQCRLDGGEWRACGSPHWLGGLGLGEHRFAVRAFTRDGRPGPAVDHSWRQREAAPAPEPQPEPGDPKPFTIEPGGGLADLHPGDPAQPLPVLVTNPNSVPIEVTSLTVAIAGESPNCTAENFELTPSSASPAAPLPVPAGDSVSLPTANVSAPAIAMLNLPVNQDPCRGAEIPLVLSGEARG